MSKQAEEKSSLQKLNKNHSLYKEAIKIKEELKKSGKTIKVRESGGLFHVIKGGYSVASGATAQVAVDNALVLQAQANLSAIAWKQELGGI
jgi:hypothetical protein